MKRIVYRATYQNAKGEPVTEDIAVFAQNLNSGFGKATRNALRNMPAGWEIVSVEFSRVTS